MASRATGYRGDFPKPGAWSRNPGACLYGAPGPVGEGAEVLDDARAQPFELRHELEADARPQEPRVAVGRVDGVREAVPGDMGVDVGAARAEQGADPVAVPGRQDREAPRACPPEQAHHERRDGNHGRLLDSDVGHSADPRAKAVL